MRERSDEALMTAFAGGSMEAFEHLYERHRRALYVYILRKAGDTATANDLYQGAWEKVIRAREKYNRNAPFRAWLYRIAHNHVIDYFRRLRPITDLKADEMESNLPGPESEALNSARSERLRTAIDQLPVEQKEVLLLKLEGGLSIDETAAVTGVNR
jgi:RNA polymerase sigma factor (sigma-70 family)